MNLNRAVLLVALVVGTMTACRADTVGPLTLGKSSPFGSDGSSTLFGAGGNMYVAPLVGQGINVNGLNNSFFFDYTYTFSFDEAAGWNIDAMKLADNVDFGGPNVGQNWGFEFAEKVTLCPVTGGCSTATTGQSAGAIPLPPLSFAAQAAAGSGVYELTGYIKNEQIATNGGMQNLNVWVSPVPEPASLLLFVTGVAGIPVVRLMRRRDR